MNKRAYKYRFYPNKDQVTLLSQTFGCVRVVYNNILQQRTNLYYKSKEKVWYPEASKLLTALKREPDFIWLNEVSSTPLQQCLRQQQSAFKNFFAGRAKYPKFRKKNHRQSAEFTKSAFRYIKGKIFLAKCKDPLDIRWSRPLPSSPSTIFVYKETSGRYFISCLCEFTPKEAKYSSNTIGIDLGLKHLVVTDAGEKISNPRHTKKYAEKLAKAQRSLSKKKIGSANRIKAKIKIARIHAKITDCRKDNLHKISRKLVNENQIICAETLKVKNMVRNHTLAGSISDAGWGELIKQLEYKSEWAGRTFIKINQYFPSSQRCSCCGYIVDNLPLEIRSWTCPSCKKILDRDTNAAANIKAAGLAVLAFGDTVNLT